MSVQKKTTKAGKVRWVGRYRDLAKKEHSKSFDTQREAKAWVAEQQRAMRRGEWIDPASEQTTIRQLAEEWVATATKPETITARKSLLLSLGPLGDMPVSTVRSSHITAWRAKLITGRDWLDAPPEGQKDRRALSESTAANTLGQLMTVLKLAHEDQLIARVPVVKEKKSAPLRAISRADLLTLERVAQVAAAAGKGYGEPSPTGSMRGKGRAPKREWLRAMILTAAGTGLRISELCGLQVHDVDFLRRVVHVRRQIGRGRQPVGLKSSASQRDVPVAQWVLDELAAYLAKRPAVDGWVWSRPDGTPHDRSSANHALKAVLEVHGLQDVQWHDFRHFYASALIFAGVPVNAVQSAMGHASAAVTLDVYAHLFPGQDDLVRAAGDALGGVRDLCGIGDGKAPHQAG